MKKLIGDRKFYSMVLMIAIPIMVQNGITNFVNLLDNVMVGRTGTEQMSGVSIVNQLIFVFNLCIFGGFSGAGIFTAQFFGKSDNEGIKETFRFKLILGIILTVLAFAILLSFDRQLITLYLNEGSDGDLLLTLKSGQAYLKAVIWSLPPFMIIQAYSSTLRECGETVVPMKAGIVSMLTNMVFNYILIFGKFGAPELGAVGAAIATVIARIAEASIVVIWTHRHTEKFPFVVGLFSNFGISKTISGKILKTGSPLLLNEALWSAGMAVLTQCYSMRGLDSVAGFNIANTVINVFKVVFLAMGNSVGIIVGRLIGAGKMEEAVDADRKIIAFAVFICCLMAGVLYALSPVFPKFYKTTDTAKAIATSALMVAAVCMPIDAFKNTTYFTLRSGGRTWITFLFDGAYTWTVSVPIAFILSRYTSLTAVQIFIGVYCGDIIKLILGFILVKKRIWLRNIVS